MKGKYFLFIDGRLSGRGDLAHIRELININVFNKLYEDDEIEIKIVERSKVVKQISEEINNEYYEVLKRLDD